MKVLKILKILYVIIFVVVIYFFSIFTMNIVLNNFKDDIRVFLSSSGINVDFEYFAITPDLKVFFKDLSISNAILSSKINDVFIHLDVRKLLFDRLPVSYVSLSNVDILLVSSNSNYTSNIGLNTYDLVRFFQRTRIEINDVNFRWNNIDFKFKELYFRVSKNYISFDFITQVKIGSRETIKLFATVLNGSSVMSISNDGSIKSLNGILAFTSNEILGVAVDDVKFNFYEDNGSIVGVALGNGYNGYVQIRNSGVEAELYIEDLLSKAYEIESFRNNIIKLKNFVPEIDTIAKSILKDTSIKIKSYSSNTFFSVVSSNLYVYYLGNYENTYLFGIYKNGNRRIVVNLDSNKLSVYVKSILFAGRDVNLSMVSRLGKVFSVEYSYLDTDVVRGKILDGLKIYSNYLLLDNSYAKVRLDLNKFEGFIVLDKAFSSQILDYLKLGNLEDLEMSLFFTNTNFVLKMFGENDDLYFGLYLNNYNLVLDNLIIKRLDTSLSGKILISGEKFEGFLTLIRGDLRDYLKVYGDTKAVFINSTKYGNIVLDPQRQLLRLSLTNLDFGNVCLNKVFGLMSYPYVNLSFDISTGVFSSKFIILGNLSNLVVTNGFLYTHTRAVEFYGNIVFDDVISGKFRIGNSGIEFNFNPSDSFLSVLGNFDKFPVSYGFLSLVSGRIKVGIDLQKSGFSSIQEFNADLSLKSEGVFNRIKLSANKMDDSISVVLFLFNYFNTFTISTYFDGSFVSSKLSFKERIGGVRRDKEILSLSGVFQDDMFKGKIKVNTQGFSGLEEKWDRMIVWSKDFLSVYGDGDGLNIYNSNKVINFSYYRNGTELYSFSGEIGDRVVGTLKGRIPLSFLLIPGFIDSIDGDVFFENVKVSFDVSTLEATGYGIISIKSVKVSFIDQTFFSEKSRVEFQGNKVIARNIYLLNGNTSVMLSSLIDLKNLSDPTLDITLHQIRGVLNQNLDLGNLKLSGASSISLNIKGRANSPIISGNMKLLKGSRVSYLIFYNEQSKDEFWGYNFAQLSEWNLTLNLSESYFESELLEGNIVDGNVLVRGSVARNNLSLTGTVTIGSGFLKYLGRYFNVDNIKMVFYGNEMDFVPFVSGTLYTFTFDNRTEENVKIIMDVSGRITSLRTSYRSEPERAQSEIAMLLGLPTQFRDTVKQGVSFFESVGIYDVLSYNIRRYTGLDVFVFRSPLLSTYFTSILEGNSFFTTRDLIKGTEIRIGKSILSSLLLEYRLVFDTLGDNNVFTNVPLHNFILGVSFYDFFLEFQYGSVVLNDDLGRKIMEFEPKVNIRYNRRF
ncbi:MAG: translocation/assembly module TamB [Brevinematales bacterium]|nr:translocation/assembly module TamB [Brevinematales bacterium]